MDRTRESDIHDKLASAGRSAGEAAASAADRVSDTLEQGRAALVEMQEMLTERTRACMHTTEEYVRDNPWQAVGIAAGLGLIVGILITRR